jgi:hypothetical protein
MFKYIEKEEAHEENTKTLTSITDRKKTWTVKAIGENYRITTQP